MSSHCESCHQPVFEPSEAQSHAHNGESYQLNIDCASSTPMQASDATLPLRFSDDEFVEEQKPKLNRSRKPKPVKSSFYMTSILEAMCRVQVIVRCSEQSCGMSYDTPISSFYDEIQKSKANGWTAVMNVKGECRFFCQFHPQKSLPEVEFGFWNID